MNIIMCFGANGQPSDCLNGIFAASSTNMLTFLCRNGPVALLFHMLATTITNLLQNEWSSCSCCHFLHALDIKLRHVIYRDLHLRCANFIKVWFIFLPKCHYYYCA